MNNRSTLNSTGKSFFMPDSISRLNRNADFSDLDISEIRTNETTTIQGNTLSMASKEITAESVSGMSISLGPFELAMLRQKQRLTKESSSNVSKLSITQAKGMEIKVQDNQSKTIAEEEEEKEEEESVVNVDDQSTLPTQDTLMAVDDEDEDSVDEAPISVLEETVEQQQTQLETPQTHERDFFKYDLIELGRRLWPSSTQMQHYTKGCLWSPDGTCLLLPVHLDGMHVIELPSDLYTVDALSSERQLSSLKSAVHVKEGGTVYDCAWYPFMNSGAPETCCWLATRQHEPIHMWDAFNGELRCSYRGYDDVDEVESAISVTFSNDGEKVLGGYKKSIKVFDTNVPGRDCASMPVKQAVSCFALTTDNDDTVTAGSWNGYINHYDLRVPKLGALFTLGGHTGGVTWLRYAHGGDHWKLFSGARKDNKILQWDMRDYTQPVRVFERNVATNQRIYFDLSAQQNWLISGDTGGLLRMWDLCPVEGEEADELTLPLHADCCNGVNFHPTRPILASCSGQYHFVDHTQDEEEEETKQMLDEGKNSASANKTKERIVNYENALLLLWCGKNKGAAEEDIY